MSELYEKVAGDNALQAKFAEIMKDAEKAGEAATKEKLTAFAKEAGYEISLDEMKAFFAELSEKEKGQLSDAELDMVAGGKSKCGALATALSIVTLGLSCAALSIAQEAEKAGGCREIFQ